MGWVPYTELATYVHIWSSTQTPCRWLVTAQIHSTRRVQIPLTLSVWKSWSYSQFVISPLFLLPILEILCQKGGGEERYAEEERHTRFMLAWNMLKMFRLPQSDELQELRCSIIHCVCIFSLLLQCKMHSLHLSCVTIIYCEYWNKMLIRYSWKEST